jgi:hypothetical protein
MPVPEEPRHTEIRSYRAVFDLERRIYRVDRLRLNPAGVSLRGCVYALIAVAGVLVGSALPVIGWPLGVLPWHVRVLVLPLGVAALATMLRIDGRPLHVALRSLARQLAGPRRTSRFAACRQPATWKPGALVFLCDGGQPRFRRLRFTGPGAVLVRRPHRRTHRRRGLAVTETPDAPAGDRGQVIVLATRARLDVRPGAGRTP